MNPSFFFWLICALVTAILELGHLGLFYFLSLSGAGCITALSTFYISDFSYQLLVFVVAGICCAWILRSVVSKRLETRSHYHSNTQALQGKRAVVTQTIFAHKPGTVKVGGELWTARALNESETIPEGTYVEIAHVAGAHLKVKKQS